MAGQAVYMYTVQGGFADSTEPTTVAVSPDGALWHSALSTGWASFISVR